jgi:hypothetical protein
LTDETLFVNSLSDPKHAMRVWFHFWNIWELTFLRKIEHPSWGYAQCVWIIYRLRITRHDNLCQSKSLINGLTWDFLWISPYQMSFSWATHNLQVKAFNTIPDSLGLTKLATEPDTLESQSNFSLWWSY